MKHEFNSMKDQHVAARLYHFDKMGRSASSRRVKRKRVLTSVLSKNLGLLLPIIDLLLK
jgi:hypothetical protein